MKTIIATTAFALTLTAPAFADTIDAQKFFALTNDSAAETLVIETSVGDPVAAAEKFALANESAAETMVESFRARSVDVDAVKMKFALNNDSAAERIVK